MHISWVLLAENLAVNEEFQRMDIVGEFRSVVADKLPYSLSKFYIIVRIEGDVQRPVTAPFKLTLGRPSNELVELYCSDVSIDAVPDAGPVVGNLIAEIRDLDFVNEGRHAITAQLGESLGATDILVFHRRNNSYDASK